MRRMSAVVGLTVLLAPCAVWAQPSDPAEIRPFSVQAAAGSTLPGPGSALAASFGYSPAPWLTLLVSGERTHVPTRVRYDGPYSTSAARGGTLHFVSLEARFHALPNARVSPYAVVGAGRGVSHPNVNEIFPTRVTNEVQMMMLGGGVRVPLRPRLAMFADARFVVGAEGPEGVVAMLPIRAGVSWRF